MLFFEFDVKGYDFVFFFFYFCFWSVFVLFGMIFLGNMMKYLYVFKIKIRDGFSNIEKGGLIDVN